MTEVEQSVQRACGVRKRKLIPALFAGQCWRRPGVRATTDTVHSGCRMCAPTTAAAPPRLRARTHTRPRHLRHAVCTSIHSNELTQALGTGAPVFLKLETVQPSGSFKLRGIGAACAAAVSAGASTLVSSSGGNAGLAVAYSARAVGVECVVVRADAAALALCCTISA